MVLVAKSTYILLLKQE